MSDDDEAMREVPDWPKVPDPDHAWKALALVNEWIRHGDAKISVTLAVTGAAGVMLYNLVKDQTNTALPLEVLGGGCAVALFLAAFFAVVGLIPQVRVGARREPEAYTNLLFYRHIAGGWNGKTAGFVHALGELTIDKQKLTKHIGEQVHANAGVARRKYVWSDRSIKALAAGLLLLALTAAVKVVG